jgi:hypothetical protein
MGSAHQLSMNTTRTLPVAALVIFLAGCAAGPVPTSPDVTSSPPPATSAPSSQPATPNALLPDGIWEVNLSTEELIAAGAPADEVDGGIYRWTFDGTRARIQVYYHDGNSIECDADAARHAEGVRLQYRVGSCGGEVDIIRWAADADELQFILVDTNAGFAGNKGYLETKPWRRVDGDPTLTWSSEDE